MTGTENTVGKVWLVGAGCGRGLLTQEGRRILSRAQTVLYDALVAPETLLEASPEAELLPVGKRSGRHSVAQEAINALLIRKAREGKRVVRLKGGDSFVFGRGGEEALALQKAGIPWQVVPGISSAIGVPEHFGIPVTHRGLARSFTVITGHTRDGAEEDWQVLAHLQGTLVFLMGLERVETICRRLIQAGKKADTPASVLCGGYGEGEKRIDGTLEDLPEKARQQGAFPPAVILVGPVAGLGLCPEAPGKKEKILVTGTLSFCREVARELAEGGRETGELPLLAAEPLWGNIPEDFGQWDWLVFTSRNGVRLFFQWFRERKETSGSWGRPGLPASGKGPPGNWQSRDSRRICFRNATRQKRWERVWLKKWDLGSGACCSGRKTGPRIWSGNWKRPGGHTGMLLCTGSAPGRDSRKKGPAWLRM